MPVEIFELIVKATVREKGSRAEARNADPGGDQKDKERLKQEAAEQALEMLKRKKER